MTFLLAQGEIISCRIVKFVCYFSAKGGGKQALEKKEKVLIDDNASLINIFQEELKRSDAKVERLRERLRVRTTSIDLGMVI